MEPRNFPLNWSAEYEGWSFFPLNSSEYEINQIPFNSYDFNEVDVFWIDENNNIVSLSSSFNFIVNESGNYVFYLCEQNDTSNSMVSILDSIQINVPEQFQNCETFTNNLSIYSPSTQNACNGLVISDVSGGVPPYTYLLNDVQSEYVSNVCTGFNTITVSDCSGCQITETFFAGMQILGCTDPDACNFNQEANIEDSTCVYNSNSITYIQSCDSFFLWNDLYITNAGVYDYVFEGSNGCDSTVQLFLEFQICGCTDSSAFNYNPLAITDDGSCELVVLGCTDELAPNFNENANTDDGSCIVCEFNVNYYTLNSSSNLNCDGVIALTYDYEGYYTISMNGIELLTTFNTQACYGTNSIFLLQENGCSLTDTLFLDADIIYGCTDQSALNYNYDANSDDGSCEYEESENPCDNLSIAGYAMDGCAFFCGAIIEIFDSNQSLVFSANYAEYDNAFDNSELFNETLCLSEGCYDLLVTSENVKFAITDLYGDTLTYINHQDNGQGDFVEGYYSFCYLIDTVVSGCTDPTAINYNEFANSYDSSCEYEPLYICAITPSGLFVDNIIHNRVIFNWSQPEVSPSHYMIRYRPLGTSSWTVMTAGPVNNNPFNGTNRTRYFMQPETTYEWNVRSRVLNEDGSTNCQSSWSASSQFTTLAACPNLENLSVSTEANWVTLNADAPSEDWGVWQSKAKMKEVGTNSFRYANGDASGNINVLKGNFNPNTEYQWHTKAWCTGNVDVAYMGADPQYHSGWGDFSYFTTEEICDKMPINLSTSSNGANTAITMNWDLPLSGTPDHYFLELNNDITGQQWQWNDIAGEQTSQTKFNLSSGEYSWRIRGACGSNGTSWATIFTQPVYYTLGGERLENKIVSDLNIFPNPSSNIFNLEFNSDSNAEILVTNILGEQVYFESVQSVGKFNTQIDLSNYSKGIYNLTIKTSDGLSNHKLILQ